MYTPYRTYEKKQSEIVVLSNIFEIQIVQAMENYSNAEKERSRFKGEESKRFKSILYKVTQIYNLYLQLTRISLFFIWFYL